MNKVNIIVVILAVALGLVEAVLRLDNESELREAQAALFNANSPSGGWILLNYVAPSIVHFTAAGEGGATEVRPLLEDDQIQYILIRESTQNGIRDVFIVWIGPDVGFIEKGKKTAFLGDAESFLQPFHASITVLSRTNFDDDTIIDRSDPLAGSHIID